MFADDLDAVLANEFTGYDFPWTRGVFKDCLKAGNQCWVLEREGEVLGHAVVTIGAGEAHLLNVCIRGSEQGRGLGRALVIHALERAHAAGADALFLEVRPSNDVAARLYDSLGFVQVGVRKDYYPAPIGHEDARVLVLDLTAYFRCPRS
ncbi:MAG: ribosomal protein S18-alanine N-acetyltransferase [Pseudomonadales bacterium]|jgi:ribosomal-protein-alanine N-acetyltransferase